MTNMAKAPKANTPKVTSTSSAVLTDFQETFKTSKRKISIWKNKKRKQGKNNRRKEIKKDAALVGWPLQCMKKKISKVAALSRNMMLEIRLSKMRPILVATTLMLLHNLQFLTSAIMARTIITIIITSIITSRETVTILPPLIIEVHIQPKIINHIRDINQTKAIDITNEVNIYSPFF